MTRINRAVSDAKLRYRHRPMAKTSFNAKNEARPLKIAALHMRGGVV